MPPREFDQTVAFYRHVLGLEHLETHGRTEAFRFGSCCRWIDFAPHLSQRSSGSSCRPTIPPPPHLAQHGVTRCHEVERLPEGFDGFWIVNPADIVHPVAHPAEDPGL